MAQQHSKVHKPLLYAIHAVLVEVFREGRKADQAIRFALKSGPRWGSKDRAFIASHSYGIVRWWRLLHFMNNTEMDMLEDEVLWQIIGVQMRMQGLTLPEMQQLSGLNRRVLKERYEEALLTRKIAQSIPDWLDERGESELGPRWEDEIVALNEEARVGLRTNILKCSRTELQTILRKEGIDTEIISDVPNGLYLKERKNVFGTKAFRNGYFEVQDPGSQLIAEFLDVSAGMRVIDACAGAGGKSLAIAAQMNNRGTLIAMDVEEWKLKELKRRAKRNGIHNIDPRLISSSKTLKRLHESCDRLLLDVPCSGTGVLRRNPDAKWKLDEAFLQRVISLQKTILHDYHKMLKPGGMLVYATCSILSSENEDQVSHFLQEHNNFKLLKERTVTPFRNGFDGFYMAALQKV